MSEFGVPRDLRAFLQELRLRKELREIRAPVDSHLEVAEIHRRVIAAGGPALWFRNVMGPRNAMGSRDPGGAGERQRSPFSTVTNLFGSSGRVDAAFGPEPERLIHGLADFLQRSMPPTPAAIFRNRELFVPLLRAGTKTLRSAPVLARRQTPPRLNELPMTTSWPQDGGAFFTLPQVYTQHPTTGVPNLGIYRMQRHDASTTGMHWQIGKGGGFHHHAAEARGEALPVNVFLGGPPATLLGALCPLPENVPELVLASLVLGGRVRMTQVPGVPLPILADAEFALVGKVPADRRRAEGPFGDHYGYYSLEHPYPVFECAQLFHRVDPILPATVVGKPMQEDYFLGEYLQRLLRPVLPLAMPAVRDLWSYAETGFHSLAAAVVRERYHREAMASAFRILGEGQLSLTKFLLVIDRGLHLEDFRTVLEHVLERFRPETDLYVFANLSMDSLDYTGPQLERGSKGVLLGVGESVRELPKEFVGELPDGASDALVFCPGCLVLQVPGAEAEPELATRLARSPALAAWPLVVLSDEARRAAASVRNFLWTTFTRFDPARDLTSAQPRIVSNHVVHTLPLLLDARMRASYPEELFCDEETARKVDRRWNEYFPGGLEQGDSDQGHLDPPLPAGKG